MEKSENLSDRGIRISGHVSPGTIVSDTTQAKVEFTVFERESGSTLPVVYQGIIPDTFKDNAEVVVEGRYHTEGNLFEANVLLAKCPSKYEALGEEHPDEIPIEPET